MTSESLQQHTLEAEQARCILESLARWIEVAPFRRVVVELDEDGKWRATLQTCASVASTHGVSLKDALAQIATAAAMEVG